MLVNFVNVANPKLNKQKMEIILKSF